MSMSSFSGLRDARWAWVLAALGVAVAVPGSAFGAERVVLGEEFTATW